MRNENTLVPNFFCYVFAKVEGMDALGEVNEIQ